MKLRLFIFISAFSFVCLMLIAINKKWTLPNISRISQRRSHFAIILTRKASTVGVSKHLDDLRRVGIEAFVMCDEKVSNSSERFLHVTDETLKKFNLERNQVWDRVFVWLYDQTEIDFVWLIEDDVTWIDGNDMLEFFDRYASDSNDLLCRNRIEFNNKTKNWMWWPKQQIDLFPQINWSGSLNMLSRVSRRLIEAHRYYTMKLFLYNQSDNFDKNFYYQEFFIPTVANMFNLSAVIYDTSTAIIDILPLSENDIRRWLIKGKQIFHPVKHRSKVLLIETFIRTRKELMIFPLR